MACKPIVKPIVKPTVTMVKGDNTFIRILTLTINENQCNTVQYTKEIDQSAASIRVELMINTYIQQTGRATLIVLCMS